MTPSVVACYISKSEQQLAGQGEAAFDCCYDIGEKICIVVRPKGGKKVMCHQTKGITINLISGVKRLEKEVEDRGVRG